GGVVGAVREVGGRETALAATESFFLLERPWGDVSLRVSRPRLRSASGCPPSPPRRRQRRQSAAQSSTKRTPWCVTPRSASSISERDCSGRPPPERKEHLPCRCCLRATIE